MLQMVQNLKMRSKIIYSFVFISLYSPQNIKADAVEVKKSTYSIKPSALSLGFDILTPTFCYIKHGMKFHNYNLHSNIDFNRIFIDLDLGLLRFHKIQPLLPPEPFQLYKGAESNAPTFDNIHMGLNFKLGFSYNFLHKNEEYNAIFAGLGYNFAYCQDRIKGELCGTSEDMINSTTIETGIQTFLVHWMDIVLGLRMSFYKNFYLGHTLHINVLKNFIRGNKNCSIPYLIGGYGREERPFNLRFEFFVGYNIPLFYDSKFTEKKRY